MGDRSYADGGFGWFGPSSVQTTQHVIHGTPYGKVFRSQREGMGGYRFTVPNGRYQIRLDFAELEQLSEFERIIDVFSEGRLDSTTLMWPAGLAAGTRSR